MKDTPETPSAPRPPADCAGCATARALTMRADSADWTAEALTVESRVLRVAVTALTTRAELAEARVKEMQAAESEQEKEKMLLIVGIKDISAGLYWATNAWTGELLAVDVRKKLRALLAGQSSPIEVLNPGAK